MSDVNGPFQQGAIETTESVTDLAIEGGGYFVLNNANRDTFYTRAGQFHLDNIQELVNPEGLNLQGAAGNISLAGVGTFPATRRALWRWRLISMRPQLHQPLPFPSVRMRAQRQWISASNFSAIAPIYDSAGQSHDLTFLFRQSAPNTWEYQVVAARSELDSLAPTSTDLRLVSTGGTLTFSSDGTFNLAASTITDIGGLNWVGGASTQAISASSLNFAGTVQYGEPSELLSVSQDGSAEGLLAGITIDEQGMITGTIF